MKYSIRVVSGRTDFGRAHPSSIGVWAHLYNNHSFIFDTKEEADKQLACGIGSYCNILDFNWAVVPITKEECVRLRKAKKP